MKEWRQFQIEVNELKEKFNIPKKCELLSIALIDDKETVVLKMWVDR